MLVQWRGDSVWDPYGRHNIVHCRWRSNQLGIGRSAGRRRPRKWSPAPWQTKSSGYYLIRLQGLKTSWPDRYETNREIFLDSVDAIKVLGIRKRKVDAGDVIFWFWESAVAGHSGWRCQRRGRRWKLAARDHNVIGAETSTVQRRVRLQF